MSHYWKGCTDRFSKEGVFVFYYSKGSIYEELQHNTVLMLHCLQGIATITKNKTAWREQYFFIIRDPLTILNVSSIYTLQKLPQLPFSYVDYHFCSTVTKVRTVYYTGTRHQIS